MLSLTLETGTIFEDLNNNEKKMNQFVKLS